MAARHIFVVLFVALAFLRASARDTYSVKMRASRPSRSLRRCSANLCSRFGSRTKCLVKRGPKRRLSRSTCFRFSRTAQSRKQCAFACILICEPKEKQPLASNGKRFCSACQLKSFSCGSRYRVYGPVKVKPSPKPSVKKVCAVSYCAEKGAAAKCKFGGKTISCGKWAFTDQKKKQCDFACIQICTDGPTDNNGKQYCSFCHFLLASCAANFKIFLGSRGGSGVLKILE